jgi:hypothetical protein
VPGGRARVVVVDELDDVVDVDNVDDVVELCGGAVVDDDEPADVPVPAAAVLVVGASGEPDAFVVDVVVLGDVVVVGCGTTGTYTGLGVGVGRTASHRPPILKNATISTIVDRRMRSFATSAP